MSEIEEQMQTLPASIGGASFRIRSAKTNIGRRNAVQEFANTDAIRDQDLGAKADAGTIEGYLIGANYLAERRALEVVFQRPGPHLLVHPFRGRMLVSVEGDGLEISEETAKLGYASISFRFKRHRADEPLAPRGDPGDVARVAVTKARDTNAASCASQVSRLSSTSVRDAFRTALSRVQSVLLSSVGSVLDVTDAAGASIVASVETVVSVVDALAATPGDAFTSLASTTRGVLRAPLTLQASAANALTSLSSGWRLDQMLNIAGRFVRIDETGLEELAPRALASDLPSSDTDAAATIRNGQAITAALRCEAAASLLEAIVETKPESKAQARAILAMINQLLHGQSDGDPDATLYAVDAESFVSLSDLRAAANRYVGSQLVALPEIETYEVPVETNAVLLAHLLLGDATRFGELVARNGIADPLFIPAGTVVEYLRSAA